jgi:hypothetical protein
LKIKALAVKATDLRSNEFKYLSAERKTFRVSKSVDPGVPLHHYRQHKAGVDLTCGGCMLRKVIGLEE